MRFHALQWQCAWRSKRTPGWFPSFWWRACCWRCLGVFNRHQRYEFRRASPERFAQHPVFFSSITYVTAGLSMVVDCLPLQGMALTPSTDSNGTPSSPGRARQLITFASYIFVPMMLRPAAGDGPNSLPKCARAVRSHALSQSGTCHTLWGNASWRW